jgi:hypothetical protein
MLRGEGKEGKPKPMPIPMQKIPAKDPLFILVIGLFCLKKYFFGNRGSLGVCLKFLLLLFINVIFNKLGMKKVCFIEFEGLLENEKEYVVDQNKARDFLSKLNDFSKKNNIELFLISGLHENVVKDRFKKSFASKIFDKEHFFFVDEKYINSKHDVDKKIHAENLEKDVNFSDSYFKQVKINEILLINKLNKEDVLLLCNDIWVDGYYTTRFSGIDFALFENNFLDRGNKVERISGLAYFSLEFDSVKILLENFPNVDFRSLEKYVFEKMKEVLLKDVDFSKLAKKVERGGN